jgi:hypothetical protein
MSETKSNESLDALLQSWGPAVAFDDDERSGTDGNNNMVAPVQFEWGSA